MIIVVGALLFGLGLIGLISRFAANVPRVDSRTTATADVRPLIPPREFEGMVRGLLGALGLDILSVSTDESGVLDMTCRDPRPIAGGRLLVRASPLTTGG